MDIVVAGLRILVWKSSQMWRRTPYWGWGPGGVPQRVFWWGPLWLEWSREETP